MVATPRNVRRFLYAMTVLALTGAAGAAFAASEWTPGAYAPSAAFKGAAAPVGAVAGPALVEEDWKTEPGRYLASPVYGRGVAWSASAAAD